MGQDENSRAAPPLRDEPGPAPGHGAEADRQCLEWCPVCRAGDVLRSNASPELRASLLEAQREALLTLRALIDAYLEPQSAAGPAAADPADRRNGVTDIPIG